MWPLIGTILRALMWAIILLIPIVVGWITLKNFLKQIRITFYAFLVKGPTKGFFIFGADMLKYFGSRRLSPLSKTWFGPVLETERPEEMESVSQEVGHGENSKAPRYKCLDQWLGHTTLLTAPGKHYDKRVCLSRPFEMRIADPALKLTVKEGYALVKKIRDLGSDTINLLPLLRQATCDIFLEAFTHYKKEEMGFTDYMEEYLEATQQMTELMYERMSRTWLWPNFAYFLSGSYRCMEKALEKLNDVVHKLWQISAACPYVWRNQYGFKSSFEGCIFSQTLGKLGWDFDYVSHLLTEDEKKKSTAAYMFMIQDVTSVALGWIFLLIGNHPDVQQLIMKELDTIFEYPSQNTSKDLDQMLYLERVIKECLRLYPPIPMIGHMLDHDKTIRGRFIPKGAIVEMNIFMTHRQPDLFPNPEEFNPDNFLPENEKYRHPMAYLPFGAGSRHCRGEAIAMSRMKTIVSMILRQFKVEAVDRVEDVYPFTDWLVRTKNEVCVKVSPRQERAASYKQA